MTNWVYPGSHDLNLLNRPVRTRMPGGVAGAQSTMTAPYADCAQHGRTLAGASPAVS